MKDPAVLFYTQDFLVGTMTMTNEHRGMYITLLCLQHQKGYLTEKDMQSICSTHVPEVYAKFEKSDDGNYYNMRMKEEASKRAAYTASRRNNAKKKEKPASDKQVQSISKAYADHKVGHMDNHMENENEDEIEVKNVGQNHLQLTDLQTEQLAMKFRLNVKQVEAYTEQVVAYYTGIGKTIANLQSLVSSWIIKDKSQDKNKPAKADIPSPTYRKL